VISAAATHSTKCLERHCFSLVESSGHYAQFAGVLTGLTFAALIFVASRDASHGNRQQAGLILLIVAFFALATSTYLFAAVASEEGVTGKRVAFEAFCAALVLAIAILHLFLGVAHSMLVAGLGEAAVFAARLAGWAISLVVFAFITETAVDASGVALSEPAAWNTFLSWGCVALASALALWQASSRWTMPQANWLTERRWATFSLAIVLISAALSGIWAERGIGSGMPEGGYFCLIGLLFASTIGFCALAKQVERAVNAATTRNPTRSRSDD
jgi:hypothetical protein